MFKLFKIFSKTYNNIIPLIFQTFLRDVISTKTMTINTIPSAKKKVKIKQARGKMIKSKSTILS